MQLAPACVRGAGSTPSPGNLPWDGSLYPGFVLGAGKMQAHPRPASLRRFPSLRRFSRDDV